MVLTQILGLLLVQAGFHHSPDGADTVRYNRDEFGVRLHAASGWKGLARLVFLGTKDSIRSEPTIRGENNSYRARFHPIGELRYAFWVDRSSYKPGATGLFFDQTGLHSTATPSWFVQSVGKYPEVKPPRWPGEGVVFYALDTARFGDGSGAEAGSKSFTKHLDYVQGLGVNGIWLDALHPDSGDTVEDAHHLDWRVVAEASLPRKDADGVAGSPPPDGKGWRIATADEDEHELIQSGGANGVLDRRLTSLLVRFIRDTSAMPSELASGIQSLRGDYPDAVSDQMILRLAGPRRPRPSAIFHADRNRQLQIWLLLLTLPGVPVIDSGDEIGLLDHELEMQWNPTQQDAALLGSVKKFIIARTSRRSLYRGEFQTLDLADQDHVFGFSRIDRQEATIVLVNNSDESQEVRVPAAQFGLATLSDLYGNVSFAVNGTTITITLTAHGFALLGS